MRMFSASAVSYDSNCGSVGLPDCEDKASRGPSTPSLLSDAPKTKNVPRIEPYFCGLGTQPLAHLVLVFDTAGTELIVTPRRHEGVIFWMKWLANYKSSSFNNVAMNFLVHTLTVNCHVIWRGGVCQSAQMCSRHWGLAGSTADFFRREGIATNCCCVWISIRRQIRSKEPHLQVRLSRNSGIASSLLTSHYFTYFLLLNNSHESTLQ